MEIGYYIVTWWKLPFKSIEKPLNIIPIHYKLPTAKETALNSHSQRLRARFNAAYKRRLKYPLQLHDVH